MYAEVVVDARGIGGTFTYGIPRELEGAVNPGTCVAVSFGNREHVGYVLSVSDKAPDVGEIKNILAIIPDAAQLPRQLLALACFLSDYYICPLSQAVRAMVPEAMTATVTTLIRLVDPTKASSSSPRQVRIIEVLSRLGGEAEADFLRRMAKVDGFGDAMRQLQRRGVVEIRRTLDLPKARPKTVVGVKIADQPAEIDPKRAPKQAKIMDELTQSGEIWQAELLRRAESSSSPLRSLVTKGLAQKTALQVRRRAFEPRQALPSTLKLTSEQEEALRCIEKGFSLGSYVTLLHGVTGSGKTEIYLRAIESVLNQGKNAIVLIPEVALTTHLLERYVSRFGDCVAVLHSRLSVGERYDEWKRIETNEARVVVGPRSAIFAPLGNLGLIVIDEEHDSSYKQENAPRYDARILAEKRAREENASVILGSATPSVESYYRAVSGDIALVILRDRVGNRPMPEVHVVDQRVEFDQGRRQVLSEILREAIAQRLRRREQVILFVNRRGYASFLLCRTCGYVPKCPNCNLAYTYHLGPRVLRCHHCNSVSPAPDVCANCGGTHIRQFGLGTQKVEEEVRNVFPEARILRMDRDTTSRKVAYTSILKAFQDGQADILVGTQMIAKGLDFPNVTLVGVVSADIALHIPDFRSAERTFQLLTQVSGRAGRGDVPGEVVVQTFSPEHHAIRSAARHDYAGFYASEIEFREELSYPPFSRLINLISADPVEEAAEQRIRKFTDEVVARLDEQSRDIAGFIDVLGPAPAPFAKLKGLYRWHTVIRDRRRTDSLEILRDIVRSLPRSVMDGISVDVDPVAML